MRSRNLKLSGTFIFIMLPIGPLILWGREQPNTLNSFGISMFALMFLIAGFHFVFGARHLCALRAASASQAPRLVRRIFPPRSFQSRGQQILFRFGGVIAVGISIILFYFAIQRPLVKWLISANTICRSSPLPIIRYEVKAYRWSAPDSKLHRHHSLWCAFCSPWTDRTHW